MSEAANVVSIEKAKKAPPEVTVVKMDDGREVGFPGSRKMAKTVEVDEHHAIVTFDFVNGATRTVKISRHDPLLLRFAAHGASQKIGDETAAEKDADDMVEAVDNMLDRLAKGEWSAPRKAGDGFSGAHVVIRAIMEVRGLSREKVVAFLDRKQAETGLSRQALYAAFRAPDTLTAPVIERLEKDKAKKAPAIDANAALDELGE